MRKSLAGFQMRVAGLAPAAANYAGISAQRTVWLGHADRRRVRGPRRRRRGRGPIGQLLPSVSPGYGFAAIIVAFVGRLHPVGILFASLLMSLLYLGGESAQMNLALPSAVTGLFQGTLLFFLLAADVFINYRLRVVRRAGAGGRVARARWTARLHGPPRRTWSCSRSPPARRWCSRRWANSSPKSPAC